MTEEIERFQYTTHDYNWVETPNGYRFKDAHALRLIDGTEVLCATPNSDAWMIHQYPMVDEAAGKKAKRTGQAIEYKSYDSEYCKTGIIKGEHVAAIRLLSDDELPWNWMGHRGTTRIRRNRMMFLGALNEREDFSIAAPVRAVPKKLSIIAHSTDLKIKAGLQPQVVGMYSFPQLYAGREFERVGDRWVLNIPDFEIELHPHQQHAVKEFKSVKQLGASLKLLIDINCSVSDFDDIANFDCNIKEVIVMKTGRRPDYNWEALFASLKLVGRIHFTFYDTPKEELNEAAG